MIHDDPLKQLQKGQYEINDWTYIDIYNRLKELSINMFKWNNLPSTMSQRFIELNLFDKGKIIFFKHEVNDSLLSLPYTYAGKLNMYYNPVERQPYSIVRTYPVVSIDESVICYNNYLRTPTVITVNNFARRLYDCQRTIDVNLIAQKTPVVITCEKEFLNTVLNAYTKIKDNAPVIVGSKALDDLRGFQVHNTGAPYVADKVRSMYHDIWKEAMDFFGINNANTDKKERLITDEANSNNEQIKANRLIMLRARQEAAEKANRLWGTNISVEFNPYVDDIERMEASADDERGILDE